MNCPLDIWISHYISGKKDEMGVYSPQIILKYLSQFPPRIFIIS